MKTSSDIVSSLNKKANANSQQFTATLTNLGKFYQAVQKVFNLTLSLSDATQAKNPTSAYSTIKTEMQMCLGNLKAYAADLNEAAVDMNADPIKNVNFKQALNAYTDVWEKYSKPLTATNAELNSAATEAGSTLNDLLNIRDSAKKISDSEVMKQIQTLINEKLGRPALEINGNLNDKNTYELVEAQWGAKAGKDYKSYNQLLAILQKEDPATTSKTEETKAAQRHIKILKIADRLDKLGLYNQADKLMSKVADEPAQPEEASSADTAAGILGGTMLGHQVLTKTLPYAVKQAPGVAGAVSGLGNAAKLAWSFRSLPLSGLGSVVGGVLINVAAAGAAGYAVGTIINYFAEDYIQAFMDKLFGGNNALAESWIPHLAEIAKQMHEIPKLVATGKVESIAQAQSIFIRSGGGIDGILKAATKEGNQGIIKMATQLKQAHDQVGNKIGYTLSPYVATAMSGNATTAPSDKAEQKSQPTNPTNNSKATMTKIQTLINEKLGENTVQVNGNLGDKNTYSVLESKYGLKAGRDFHNYQQLLDAVTSAGAIAGNAQPGDTQIA